MRRDKEAAKPGVFLSRRFASFVLRHQSVRAGLGYLISDFFYGVSDVRLTV